MFFLTRPSRQQIAAFLDRQASAQHSYAEVAMSQQEQAPPGYTVDHNRIRLGTGEPSWDSAKRAIRSWQMFNFNWIELCWPNVPVQPGVAVAILVSHFGFYSLNASKIVYVIDEPRRFGFAYGTLREHAESGEERFLVEWNTTDDSVWYDLFAFSRPRAMLAKLARPLARNLQMQFARDSLAAMVDATSQARFAPRGG